MDSGPIKILFCTFSRSDYASTAPIFRFFGNDNRFVLELLVGGSHLLDRFGQSVNDVTKAGFSIDYTSSFLGEDDNSAIEIARAYVRLCDDLIKILDSANADCVFILGDRWEMLGVATVCKFFNIPVIHHSGGDLTLGSSDNQTRFAISAHSHLHMTAHEEHSERLCAVGEEEWRVETVGEPALTHLKSFEPISRSEFLERFGVSPQAEGFALATFHPTSFDDVEFADQIELFLEVLNRIELPIIITAPNPDVASNDFYKALQSYANDRSDVVLVESMGVEGYYSAMSYADFMVGNSSSGIWEAPSFQLPVINIGERQAGRIRATNVVDIGYGLEEFASAMKELKSSRFQKDNLDCTNPYVKHDCLSLMADFVADKFYNSKLMEKVFVDGFDR